MIQDIKLLKELSRLLENVLVYKHPATKAMIAPLQAEIKCKLKEMLQEITTEDKLRILQSAIVIMENYEECRLCDAIPRAISQEFPKTKSWELPKLSYIFPEYTKKNARKISGFKDKGYQWFREYDFPKRIEFLRWMLSKYETN